MPVAVMSSKGQIVIPADVRRRAGLRTRDKVVVDFDPATATVTLSRAETLQEMSQRFTAWIDPATPVLESASDYYAAHRAELP